MRFFDANCRIGLPCAPELRPLRTAGELLRAMDRSGVERALVWHAAMRQGAPRYGNQTLTRELAPHRDRLTACWTALPPATGEFPPPDVFLRDMRAAGARALRLFPATHRYALSRTGAGDWLEALAAARVPLFLPMDGEISWRDVGDLLADFPALTVVLSDTGLWGTDRLFAPLVDRFPNVHLELSTQILAGGVEEFVRRHPAERLLYGSGLPGWDQGGLMLTVRHADIPDAAKEAIAHGNLERLLAWGQPDARAETRPAEIRSEPLRPASALARAFWRDGRAADCPVLDLHGHMGEHYAIHFPLAEAEAMVAHMDRSGVAGLCFSHHVALFGSPTEGNRLALAAAAAHPGRLWVYVAVNPHFPDDLRHDLEQYDATLCAGLKFLSAYHGVKATDDRYRPALEFADAMALPILMHTWGGCACCGVEQVRALAAKYPRARILAGHSFNPDWEAAVAVAREFPNVYLECTSFVGRRGVLEFFVERMGHSRQILYGTDLPWFDERHGVGSVLNADISDEDVHNILHRNAARLLGADKAGFAL